MITALLLVLLSCTVAKTECSEEKACSFGSVCVSGVCQAQTCATSDQCGIEQYCSDHRCTDGCQLDADCRFGDVCDEKATCTPALCSDTRLDCSLGEFCSPAGECYTAGGYYCKSCQDDGDCGGNGNLCLNGGTCGVTCSSDADCPGGFDCYPIYDFNGNIQSHQCWTDCSRLED